MGNFFPEQFWFTWVQAGAELCQAQYKLELAKFWIGSIACLKFDCFVQTGVVAIAVVEVNLNQNIGFEKI